MKAPSLKKQQISTSKTQKKADAFIKGTEEVRRFSCYFPAQLYKELKITAVNKDCDMNSIVVEAIKKILGVN